MAMSLESMGLPSSFSSSKNKPSKPHPQPTPPQPQRNQRRKADSVQQRRAKRTKGVAPAVEYRGNCPRFDFTTSTGSAAGMQHLRDHGFAVSSSVLSAEDIAKAKDLFWDWMEQQSPSLKRGDVSTWQGRAWKQVCTSDVGMVWKQSFGHSDFAWYVRSRPGVKTTFARVWSTEDLLVSFDCCGVFRPWRCANKPQWRTRSSWYHLDQNGLRKTGLQCVQGLVSLYDATPATGGLTLVPDSHKHFDSISKRLAQSSKASWDFVNVPSDDEVFRTLKPQVITCKAGDMVLWDSRIIHCNSPGLPTDQLTEDEYKAIPASQASDLLRLVCYVCMTPRGKATADTLVKRRQAVLQGQTSTHWPHEWHISSKAPWNGYAPSRYVVPELVDGTSQPLSKEL